MAGRIARAVGGVWTGITSYIRREQARYGALFILPTLLFFCVFIVWPVGY